MFFLSQNRSYDKFDKSGDDSNCLKDNLIDRSNENLKTDLKENSSQSANNHQATQELTSCQSSKSFSNNKQSESEFNSSSEMNTSQVSPFSIKTTASTFQISNLIAQVF